MTYITDKTEQAIFINENGCSDLNCLTCKFITGTCRVYKHSVYYWSNFHHSCMASSSSIWWYS